MLDLSSRLSPPIHRLVKRWKELLDDLKKLGGARIIDFVRSERQKNETKIIAKKKARESEKRKGKDKFVFRHWIKSSEQRLNLLKENTSALRRRGFYLLLVNLDHAPPPALLPACDIIVAYFKTCADFCDQNYKAPRKKVGIAKSGVSRLQSAAAPSRALAGRRGRRVARPKQWNL